MNMNSPRLADKLNGVALATIVAIVVSIMCACVSIMAADSGAYGTAQAKSPSKIASANMAVVRR